jgi:putative SOS response-associated peptidase YedK
MGREAAIRARALGAGALLGEGSERVLATYNARGESAFDKPAFRAAMRRRRCLLPVDGFYEWKRDGSAKRPYYIRRRDGNPMAIAGLWETWTGPDGEEIDSAAIVTTAANATLMPLHDRMPVVVPPEAFDRWLDCAMVDAQAAATIIGPAPDGLLELYEVSPAVNRVANDNPELIVPVLGGVPPGHALPQPAKKARPKADDGQFSLF